MATNVLKTRIQLKHDTITNWNSSSMILKKGQIGIAEIPTASSNSGLTPPAIGIKVGDGANVFSSLPWIQATAGDIYQWAKAATKPTYVASEISGLNDYVTEIAQNVNTVYRIQADSSSAATTYTLQSKSSSAADSAYVTVSTLDLTKTQMALDINALKQLVGDVSVAQQIANAINNLDVTDAAVATKLVSSVSQENGKISVTRRTLVTGDIPNLNTSKLTSGTLGVERGGTGASTLPSGQVIVGNGTQAVTSKAIDTEVTSGSANLITSGAVSTAITQATAGLTGAMHFRGTVGKIPPASGTYSSGDVVLYGNKEYIYDGSTWSQLGDESSYAQKTIAITGIDGLTGGGTLTTDRTISHTVPSGAAASTKGTSGGRKYIQTITTDKFGHITGVTTGEQTVVDTDTTYTFSPGTTQGAFRVTPKGGSAQSVSVYGLGSAAYKEAVTILDNSINLPTSAAIKSVTDTKANTSDLSAIAFDGEVKNLNQTDATILVFDCGSSTTVIQ